MTIEQRLKHALGERDFVIAMLETKIELLEGQLASVKPTKSDSAASPDADPSDK